MTIRESDLRHIDLLVAEGIDRDVTIRIRGTRATVAVTAMGSPATAKFHRSRRLRRAIRRVLRYTLWVRRMAREP